MSKSKKNNAQNNNMSNVQNNCPTKNQLTNANTTPEPEAQKKQGNK